MVQQQPISDRVRTFSENLAEGRSTERSQSATLMRSSVVQESPLCLRKAESGSVALSFPNFFLGTAPSLDRVSVWSHWLF